MLSCHPVPGFRDPTHHLVPQPSPALNSTLSPRLSFLSALRPPLLSSLSLPYFCYRRRWSLLKDGGRLAASCILARVKCHKVPFSICLFHATLHQPLTCASHVEQRGRQVHPIKERLKINTDLFHCWRGTVAKGNFMTMGWTPIFFFFFLHFYRSLYVFFISVYTHDSINVYTKDIRFVL